MSQKIDNRKLLALIIMLFPIISIIGFLIYVLGTKITGKELIVAILTIPFGILAAIFLWLNAFGIISL